MLSPLCLCLVLGMFVYRISIQVVYLRSIHLKGDGATVVFGGQGFERSRLDGHGLSALFLLQLYQSSLHPHRPAIG